ncbi:SMI1/KNR4 family protein [Deinococcus fonticola]|uniref:SMI1/KNR4 family protein n=1 Tax=Deinococcus fonticola TaxID=2528713 RepID=UPI0010756B37|nr:SMI1/KNR4 family protein [Deinococcus fonticola]
MMNDVYNKLNNWLDKSQGKEIVLDQKRPRAFERVKRHTPQDITEFEVKTGKPLPQPYATFLKDVGACRLFLLGGIGVEFLCLDEMAAFYTLAFPGEDFNDVDFLLPVTISAYGSHLLMRSDGKIALSDVDMLPEDWDEFLESWVDFDEWLSHLVNSGGNYFYGL